MLRLCVCLCLALGGLTFAACSSDVSDSNDPAGSDAEPLACPSGGPTTQQEAEDMLGKPCDATGAAARCSSDMGCGGCLVECIDGVWATQGGAEVCYTIGGDC